MKETPTPGGNGCGSLTACPKCGQCQVCQPHSH